MKVRQPNTFYFNREADFSISAGMGDEQTMKWILKKIESLPIHEE